MLIKIFSLTVVLLSVIFAVKNILINGKQVLKTKESIISASILLIIVLISFFIDF